MKKILLILGAVTLFNVFIPVVPVALAVSGAPPPQDPSAGLSEKSGFSRTDWKVISGPNSSKYITDSTDPNAADNKWTLTSQNANGSACANYIQRSNTFNSYVFYERESSLTNGCQTKNKYKVKFETTTNTQNDTIVYHWVNSATIERYQAGEVPSVRFKKTTVDNNTIFVEQTDSLCKDSFVITNDTTYSYANYTASQPTNEHLAYAFYPNDEHSSYQWNTVDKLSKSQGDDCYVGTKQGDSTIATIIISSTSNKGLAADDYSQVIIPNGTKNPGATTCAIDGIGWIVCPVVTFLSFVADRAFGFLADNFLVFDANYLIADSSNPTFTAWQQMLVFANIGLVIFFILIIFSQITGFGISNYGIKKMLPKLIITVILMNLSFFIVQIAADLSNILGYSLKSFFGTISEQYDVLNVASFDTTNGIFSGIALTVLGGVGAVAVVGSAGGISGALVAFLPILLAGLIALIMIFFILIARQVLLILLTVLAPIAFLAYLLPNTQKWFTRWYKTLIALLMVFPIVGLVYGASDLASQVIMSATFGDNLLGSVIGAAVMTLPLFLVPIILKKSLDSIPAISGKINSFGSKVSDRTTGAAKDRLGKSYMGQKAGYNKKQAEIKRAQIQGGSGTGLRSRMYGRFNASNVSGGFGDQAAARGAQIAQSQEEENIKNAAALLSGLTSTQMSDLAMGNNIKDSNGRNIKADRHTRRAALREAGKYATADGAHELMQSVAGTTGADRLSYGSDLVSALSANAGLKQSAPWIGGATYGSLTDETRTEADFEAGKLSTEALSAGKISASQVASMGAGDIDGMRKNANDALTKATAALSSARTQDERDKANAAIAQANTAKIVLRSIGVQIRKDDQLKQQVPENSTKAASIHDLTLIP